MALCRGRNAVPFLTNFPGRFRVIQERDPWRRHPLRFPICVAAFSVCYPLLRVLPFSRGLGPAHSGLIKIGQKPFSSSAPRLHTWIIATSIRMCNCTLSRASYNAPSANAQRPPTPSLTKKGTRSEHQFAPFIFEV